MGGTLAKIVAGAGVLIGMYLVLTNPKGTSAAENSLASGSVNITKALQGR